MISSNHGLQCRYKSLTHRRLLCVGVWTTRNPPAQYWYKSATICRRHGKGRQAKKRVKDLPAVKNSLARKQRNSLDAGWKGIAFFVVDGRFLLSSSSWRGERKDERGGLRVYYLFIYCLIFVRLNMVMGLGLYIYLLFLIKVIFFLYIPF